MSSLVGYDTVLHGVILYKRRFLHQLKCGNLCEWNGESRWGRVVIRRLTALETIQGKENETLLSDRSLLLGGFDVAREWLLVGGDLRAMNRCRTLVWRETWTWEFWHDAEELSLDVCLVPMMKPVQNLLCCMWSSTMMSVTGTRVTPECEYVRC